MKIIKKIKSEDILTIDIETVREYEELKNAPESHQSDWEYKNKQDGEIPDFLELSRLYENKAPLYPEFSKICAISISYLSDEGILKCKSYAGTDEIKLLEDFAEDLELFFVKNRSYRLMGHAAKYFDYPFLCKRYMLNDLEVPSYIDESDKKPWEMRNLCTNDLWKSFGTGPGSSLQALCGAFRIPTSKVDLVGDEVGKAYYNGEIDRIGMYCNYDVVATFNVFRKYKREPIFDFEEVVYVDNSKKIEKKPIEVTVFDHILASGQLSKPVIKAIVDKSEELDLPRQDVLDLCISALSNINGGKQPNEEDYLELKENLGLVVDYNKVSCVVSKGNLAKRQVNELIKIYGKSSKKEKQEVINLVEQFLIEKNKINQKTAKESLDYLKNNL